MVFQVDMYLLKTYLFLYRDFQSLSVKLDEKKASLQDLYKCYLGAKHVKRLIKSLDEMSSNLINETFVGPMSRKADALSNFIGLVEATLDMVRKKTCYVQTYYVQMKVLSSRSKVLSCIFNQILTKL